MKYNVYLNQGNEYLGSEKSVSVGEVLTTVSLKFLADECHHENPLVPVQVIESVLSNFGKTAARLMAEGMAIPFMNGNDVLMRIYPDIHVKGGNINLTRAKELDPTVTELTLDNASDLVAKAGVTVRAYAECERKFTELLLDQKASVTKNTVIEKAKILKTEGGSNTPDTGGSSTTPDDDGDNS